MPRPLTEHVGRSLVRELTLVGVGVIVGGILVTGFATFRIWQRGTVDETRPVDAIVVMGAAQYDGRPSAVLASRLDHAVRLYAEGVAPVLIVTGGRREGDRTTEAATARAYAVAHGVPDIAILDEDHGRSTLESLEAVAGILRAHGMRSALFVSDRTHMLRVIRMAKDLEIEAYGSPTTTSPTDASLGTRLDATLHELGALAFYGLAGGPIGPELGPAGPPWRSRPRQATGVGAHPILQVSPPVPGHERRNSAENSPLGRFALPSYTHTNATDRRPHPSRRDSVGAVSPLECVRER